MLVSGVLTLALSPLSFRLTELVKGREKALLFKSTGRSRPLPHLLNKAAPRPEGHGLHFAAGGVAIALASMTRSNVSASRCPRDRAASRSVEPCLWACLAMAAALS